MGIDNVVILQNQYREDNFPAVLKKRYNAMRKCIEAGNEELSILKAAALLKYDSTYIENMYMEFKKDRTYLCGAANLPKTDEEK